MVVLAGDHGQAGYRLEAQVSDGGEASRWINLYNSEREFHGASWTWSLLTPSLPVRPQPASIANVDFASTMGRLLLVLMFPTGSPFIVHTVWFYLLTASKFRSELF